MKNNKQHFKKIQILVVDDNPDARNALVEYLIFCFPPVIVIAASSGVEALEILNHQLVDLVVSDFDMDNGNGKFLLEGIQNLNLKIPFIFFSGRLLSSEEFSYPYIYIISKLNIEHLKKVIEPYLQNY